VASDGLDTLGAGAIIQYSSWSETAKECVYSLLKAVEDANKINQDNTTLIVVDIKEREVRHEAPAAEEPETPPAEPVSRLADASIPDEPEEPRSYKWIIVLVLLGLVGGGVFFAWQTGLFGKAVEQGTELVEATTQSIEAEPEPEPEPVVDAEPEPVAEPEPEPEPEPVYVDKADVFRDSLKSGGHGPTMIKVPAGKFRMGGATAMLSPDEVPRHKVNIPSFMVSVYEVTFAEYYRFAAATGRKKPKSRGWDRKTHPVVSVTWDDALAYTRWLSKQTGKRYRLLSESEWEYVARAGTRTSFWWGTRAGTGNAHCFDCKTDYSTSKPAKVGTYKPNAFGLYDTAGNLFEWVHDCYHRNYKDAPDDGSVWEGGDCDVRIVRGGSYGSPADSMRVENRNKFKSSKGQYNVGIRVARDL
jgi:formylglycine-generating enzyme required for sulfatase activity